MTSEITTAPRSLDVALLKAVGLDRLAPEQQKLALAIAERYDLDLLLKHLVMIEHAQKVDIAVAGPTPERLIAIRTELIRLCHSPGETSGQIVARADAYLSFILTGTPTKGETINAD